MLRKRILPLMVLLIGLAPPLFAQMAAVPAENAGDAAGSNAYRTYEVKKGDTLWGISRKFIDDPYYWPDLWANNPDIQNPHVITPGQKLRIYGGPIAVVGSDEEERPAPPVAAEGKPEIAPAPVVAPPATATELQVTITVPSGISFISESEQASRGTIFDFPVDRHFAGSGDTVFVRVPPGMTVHLGDRFYILKSRAEILHPRSKKRLGFQVDQLGTLEITALGKDLQTAIIRKNFQEIERGAWLAPSPAIRQQVALRRATRELEGLVVSTSSAKEMQGVNETLFIDFGEKSGLRVGNLLTLTRSGKATELAQIRNKADRSLAYPEELIGYALVVETNPETATAVILKSLGPAVIGDRVRTQSGPQNR